MKKERKSTATIRKASKQGVITQRPMSFKVDIDLWEWMASEPNKGGLINRLLRDHYEHQQQRSATLAEMREAINVAADVAAAMAELLEQLVKPQK